MHKYEITKRIEQFAPLETQEDWDCSGWQIDVNNYDQIHKIMLCLTITDDVVRQAKEQNCDMIISHHPCFYIPLEWRAINIYAAHTNMDKAKGGTTDTLVDVTLNLLPGQYNKQNKNILKQVQNDNFLRIAEFYYPIPVSDFSGAIKQISPNARLINNKKVIRLKKIAFCAGSGSEFINVAKDMGADCLVTGDLKFHTALDSPIVVYDIGHYESEILILPVFEKIIGKGVKIVYADEHSPFSLI